MEKERMEELAQLELEQIQERAREQEIERMNRIMQAHQEWDSTISSLINDPLLTMHLLSTLLESILIEYEDKDFDIEIQEWQTKVVGLIERVNEMQASKTNRNLDEVRQIALIMEHICVMARVDMSIEQMDTSEDETAALQFAEKEWQQELQFQDAANAVAFQDQPLGYNNQWFPAHEIFHAGIGPNEFPDLPPLERDNDDLPIASITRRVGLTLPQLKEMARFRGQKITGSKEELCLRLANAGWIRLV